MSALSSDASALSTGMVAPAPPSDVLPAGRAAADAAPAPAAATTAALDAAPTAAHGASASDATPVFASLPYSMEAHARAPPLPTLTSSYGSSASSSGTNSSGVATLRTPERQRELQLISAAEFGDLRVVEELLGMGVSIEARNERRLTPLLASVKHPHAALVTRKLISMGADVNAAVDDLQQTPLHLACQVGNVLAVKLLLLAGARIDAVDVLQRTVLHYAALACPPALVHKLHLRSRGMLLNAADVTGYTPLMLAAEHGATETVRTLLACGADFMMHNTLDHRADEVADWFGHQAVVALITAAMRAAGLARDGRPLEPIAMHSPAMHVATPTSNLLSPLSVSMTAASDPSVLSVQEVQRVMPGSGGNNDPVGLALASSASNALPRWDSDADMAQAP